MYFIVLLLLAGAAAQLCPLDRSSYSHRAQEKIDSSSEPFLLQFLEFYCNFSNRLAIKRRSGSCPARVSGFPYKARASGIPLPYSAGRALCTVRLSDTPIRLTTVARQLRTSSGALDCR